MVSRFESGSKKRKREKEYIDFRDKLTEINSVFEKRDISESKIDIAKQETIFAKLDKNSNELCRNILSTEIKFNEFVEKLDVNSNARDSCIVLSSSIELDSLPDNSGMKYCKCDNTIKNVQSVDDNSSNDSSHEIISEISQIDLALEPVHENDKGMFISIKIILYITFFSKFFIAYMLILFLTCLIYNDKRHLRLVNKNDFLII